MIHNANNPILSVQRVARFRWKARTYQVAPRPYAALALRLQGTGVIQADGKEYIIGENDIVYLPQGLAYTAEYSDTEMIAIHFITAEADTAVTVYTPGNRNTLLMCFQKALTQWERKKPESKPYTLSTLYEILGVLCQDCEKENYPASLSTAMAYIQENYTNSTLRVCQICSAAHISESALRQLFWKYHKKTPVEYINGLRIELARDYIAQGLSVAEAANKCGFHDPKYFARVVKQQLGCSPKNFKLYGK
jgi:AraC-like DNA-binding protein